jgi:hypothetical protein
MTLYEATPPPVDAGACHVTVAVVVEDALMLAFTDCGAPGGAEISTALDVPAGPLPTAFVATT